MASIDIVLLGTGSPVPDPRRAGPSTLVRAGGRAFLVDCGRGVLMRAAAVGASAGTLTASLLTHLHSDHLTDLNDVITTAWITSFEPSPQAIIGPPGTRGVVEHIIESLRPDISYRLAHHADLTWEPSVEVKEVTEGIAFDDGVVRVVAAPTEHRPAAPSAGYRVEHDGQAVVLAGDTVPCGGLDQLCVGAGALVCTVIRDDLIRALGIPRFSDVCEYHSTVEQAADTARRAGVATLVLTHCVPPVPAGGEDAWRAIAARAFDGEVVVASDLDSIDLG